MITSFTRGHKARKSTRQDLDQLSRPRASSEAPTASPPKTRLLPLPQLPSGWAFLRTNTVSLQPQISQSYD